MHLLSTSFLGFTILAAVCAASPLSDSGSVTRNGTQLIIECGPKSHQCCWVARAIYNGGSNQTQIEYFMQNHPDSITTSDDCCYGMGVTCSKDKSTVLKM